MWFSRGIKLNTEQYDELILLLNRLAGALERLEEIHNGWSKNGVEVIPPKKRKKP